MENVEIETKHIDFGDVKFSGSTNNSEIKKVVDDVYKTLKNRVTKPQEIKFNLISNDTKEFNSSIANGIRRTALSEIKSVKRLVPTKFETNDANLNALMDDIIHWFEMMPILQTVPEEFKTKLNYTNNTQSDQTLRTSMIGDNISNYINDYQIIDIAPGRYINIEFEIKKKHSFEDGKYKLVNKAISIPVEKNSKGEYVLANFSNRNTATTSFKNFKIIIGTNGEVKPDKLIKDVYEDIKIRLGYIKKILNNFKFQDEPTGKNTFITNGILSINNESKTITQMIINKVYELIPDIPYIADWYPDETVRNVEIKIKFTITREEMIRVFSTAIDDLIGLFANLYE